MNTLYFLHTNSMNLLSAHISFGYHLSYSDNMAEKVYYTISGSRRESDND